MKRLNLRMPKPFENIWKEDKEERRQFFIVAEGPTEESYFTGVKNNRRELDIGSDVHIEVIPKSEGEESLSHPCQLVTAALVCMGRMDEDGNELPKDEWEKKCKWDYRKDVDLVCVIFDRDYRRLEERLDWIYDMCKKHGIYIGISNPNFELWLLMHFPNIHQYDRTLLLTNPKNLRRQVFTEASAKKKYLEILLSKVAGGYTKGSSLKFTHFIGGISLALEQEKLFEENEDLLKDTLGCNIGILLKKMKFKETEDEL